MKRKKSIWTYVLTDSTYGRRERRSVTVKKGENARPQVFSYQMPKISFIRCLYALRHPTVVHIPSINAKRCSLFFTQSNYLCHYDLLKLRCQRLRYSIHRTKTLVFWIDILGENCVHNLWRPFKSRLVTTAP